MNLIDKINCLNIINSHLATLQNDNTKKADLSDYFTFLILPLLVAVALVKFGIYLKDSAINIIITTLSIFVGLMFNIIVLLFDIVKREAHQKIKNIVLKQLLANISFAILLSVVAILLTLLTFFDNCWVKLATTFITYFLLTLFLMTLLMILKRMYNIFKNEMDELERQQNKPVEVD